MRPAHLSGAVLVALALAVTVLPTPRAGADGPRTRSVVARGSSLYGAPWQIRFGEEPGYGGEPDYATFLFMVGTKAERDACDGCGFYSSIPLPLPRNFTFDATLGSEFDSYPEGDMAGTAGPLVSRLTVKMADGSELEAELLRAPRRLVAHHPRLRRFRFFDLFFPDTSEPVSVSAEDRQGRLLEKRTL